MTVISAYFARRKAAQMAAQQAIAGDDEARYRPIEWALIRRWCGWLAPYKGQYAFGIFLCMITTVLEMLAPLYIKWLLDTAIAATASGADKHAAEMGVLRIIILWAFTLATALLVQRWLFLIMFRVGETVQFDLRRAVFKQLQRLSMNFYDKTKLGRIISRCTSDVNSMRDLNVWGIARVVVNSLMIVVAAAMMMRTSPRLFLAICWLGPVLFVCNVIYRAKAGFAFQVVREGFTRVSSNLAENITGVRVVTAFNRQEPNLGVFNDLQETNTENNLMAARINGVYQPLLQVLGFIGRIIIIFYGAYLVAIDIRGNVGSVVMALLYWDWFMNPILDFGNLSSQLMMAMAGAERVFNLLDMTPDVQDVPDAKPLPRIEGRVAFEHVTFGYNPDRPVLHDINFDASHGQMIALVGATGSGKSSIISLISRFYQPQQGRVLVDGFDIRHITGESLHKQTGLVLQQNYLFSGTVMENIRYARPSASDDEVIAAARAIGSHDAIMSLHSGYQSDVGERGAGMSLGQRQLICFTRAFLADPRIFMLDEATSAVDTGTEMLVQESLERLLAGRTTFIVAHRLSTILRADCILVIDAGRIVERGTHRELLAAQGKYAALYEQFSHHAFVD